MTENDKAAKILATYKQLKEGASDVSADLLFSTATNLVNPPYLFGTATGIAATMDAKTEANQIAKEIEAQ